MCDSDQAGADAMQEAETGYDSSSGIAMTETSGNRLPERCAFCCIDSPDSAIRLDIRRHECEPWACGPCYEYLLSVVDLEDPVFPDGCLVCLSPSEDTGTRFRLCDGCWMDIQEGRRVLMCDGGGRTPPTELLTGEDRLDPITGSSGGLE